jgi:hypothetical protein
MTCYQYPDYMYHYGIKGMKWGIRRYQNDDGTLTSVGKKREQWLESKNPVMKQILNILNENLKMLK